MYIMYNINMHTYMYQGLGCVISSVLMEYNRYATAVTVYIVVSSLNCCVEIFYYLILRKLQAVLLHARTAACRFLWSSDQLGTWRQSVHITTIIYATIHMHASYDTVLQVSNMLVPSEAPQQKVEISESVLLCLYEAVHLNRNFITVLTHVNKHFTV